MQITINDKKAITVKDDGSGVRKHIIVTDYEMSGKVPNNWCKEVEARLQKADLPVISVELTCKYSRVLIIVIESYLDLRKDILSGLVLLEPTYLSWDIPFIFANVNLHSLMIKYYDTVEGESKFVDCKEIGYEVLKLMDYIKRNDCPFVACNDCNTYIYFPGVLTTWFTRSSCMENLILLATH